MSSLRIASVSLLFLIGDIKTAATVFFLLMWLAHYVHRVFIYPFQMRAQGQTLSAVVQTLLSG
jgi:hypothetical protein